MITLYAISAFRPELKGVIRDIRVVWMLEELKMPYERVVMDSLSREHKREPFLKLNPFGKVPTIVDGDFVLFESAAICTYLGEKAGRLIPKAGTKERYVHDQWACFAISTFEPMTSRVFNFDFFQDKSPSIDKARTDAMTILNGFLKTVEQELGKRPYLSGEEFTVADLLFTTAARNIHHTELSTHFPNVQGYLNQNQERPGFIEALRLNGEK